MTIAAQVHPRASAPRLRHRSPPSASRPLRAINQEMMEFEFHISPVCSSSRPQTGVGTYGASSSMRSARSLSSVRHCGLSTASATSGITPSRQDHAVAPAPYLVAEEPKAARCVCADGALRDDASLAALAPRGRLLDHEPALWHADFERGVIQV